MIESVIETYGNELAKARGYFVRKMAWVGRRAAPDRFYSRDDTGPFLVEYKRPGGKPDPLQDREIKRLRAAGVTVYTIDSKDDCQRVFRERD